MPNQAPAPTDIELPQVKHGTAIQWTHIPGYKGETLNPIRARNKITGALGHWCQKVSPGCTNCYAETLNLSNRFKWATHAPYTPVGRKDVEIILHEETLRRPLSWKSPRAIFHCDMSDAFGDWVPFEWLDQMFAVYALTPQHIHLLLTKRPERMADYLNGDGVQHRIAKAMDVIEVQREIDVLDEAWKPVGGFPGYEVSNHGRVRGPRGLLTADVGEQGHGRVTLYAPDGLRVRVSIHRLVLRVWRDEALSDDVQVRHRNGDPTCNALPNLLVGTQEENWSDSKRHGSHRRYSKLTPDDVATIKARADAGESAYAIAKDYPVSDTQIRNILRGDQWSTDAGIAWPMPGVWLGTSVENQQYANLRLPHLLACPAAVRFVSYEPALGPVVFPTCVQCHGIGCHDCFGDLGIKWLIIGGESGDDRRPCEIEWFEAAAKQCAAGMVACFVKQDGASRPGQRNRLPDHLWNLKQFPRHPVHRPSQPAGSTPLFG